MNRTPPTLPRIPFRWVLTVAFVLWGVLGAAIYALGELLLRTAA